MTEKERILQMIADGKISVEDGEKLLRAIGESSASRSADKEVTPSGAGDKESLRNVKLVIDVKSAKGENVKFNVPIKLATWISKFIPEERLAQIEAEGINIQEILANITEFIDDATEKDIVNITSSNGDQVRVYIDG